MIPMAFCPNGHLVPVHPGEELRCPTCRSRYLVTYCPNGHGVEITGDQCGQVVRCAACQSPFVAPHFMEAEKKPAAPRSAVNVLRVLLGRAGGLARTARVLLIAGVGMVILSRGCNAIKRSANLRASVAYKHAQARFNDEWQAREKKLRDEQMKLRNKKNLTDADQARLRETGEKLVRLRSERHKARQALGSGAWKELEADARDAKFSFQMGQYWWEWIALIGILALAAGLLATSLTESGAMRWVCLGLFALSAILTWTMGTSSSGFYLIR